MPVEFARRKRSSALRPRFTGHAVLHKFMLKTSGEGES
jgi:hypothetical protein